MRVNDRNMSIKHLEPLSREPCNSCFKNQNKIGIFYIALKLKSLNVDLLCFSRAQEVVLKVFILFLKEQSGLERVQASSLDPCF